MYKKIIVAFSLLLVFSSIYSQYNESKQPLSVKLDIAGKGAPSFSANEDSSDYYFATINVFNTQDTSVTFFIMTCSWAMDGFVIAYDSITFQSCFPGCDSNIPEKITLLPQKTIQFYCTIKSWKKDLSIPKIKIGFKFFRTWNDVWCHDGLSYKKILDKIVWSNEVELRDNLYQYEIK